MCFNGDTEKNPVIRTLNKRLKLVDDGISENLAHIEELKSAVESYQSTIVEKRAEKLALEEAITMMRAVDAKKETT